MQFSAVLNMFIVKTYLNSIFTHDLKEKKIFRKMFKVTEYAALRYTASTCENLSSVFANNKGADQTVHPHSLISSYSAPVIHLLECVISKRNFFFQFSS